MCKSNQDKDNRDDTNCICVETKAVGNTDGSLSDDDLSQVNGGALTFGREKLKGT